MSSKVKAPFDLLQIRCSGCGRFLGYESIKRGFAILLCPKCKKWTVQVGSYTDVERVLKNIGPFLEVLTKEKMSAKVSNEGR